MVKRLSTMQETEVRSLDPEDPLEKEMALDSSTIAWKIPWTIAPPGSLCSRDSPDMNTGVGYRALLQGIFPIQGFNLYLL